MILNIGASLDYAGSPDLPRADETTHAYEDIQAAPGCLFKVNSQPSFKQCQEPHEQTLEWPLSVGLCACPSHHASVSSHAQRAGLLPDPPQVTSESCPAG